VTITTDARRISRVLIPNQIDALIQRLDRLQELTEALAKVGNDLVEQQDLSERIRREILAAKGVLTSSDQR
jgi:hypothetical protein